MASLAAPVADVRPPCAAEFLSRFLEAFSECIPKTPEEQKTAWTYWTDFMTGKSHRYWSKKCVLPTTAEKLGLKCEHEYLHLDLVFYPAGDPWGNFVAVEHEHDIGSFEDEIVKLMSVLAPLKVGIVYNWNGDQLRSERLLELIRKDFKTRHGSILEAPQTEYLFLLGVGLDATSLHWKHLSFTVANGPTGSWVG